jgi:hypothetical protein
MSISIMLSDITEQGESIAIDPKIAYGILQSIPEISDLKYVKPDEFTVELINGKHFCPVECL